MAHSIESGALEGVVADFVDHQQSDLIARWRGHHAWWESRSRSGVDPYSKFTASRITTRCEAGARNGESYAGVNFASQDYLNLAAHPAVHQAAKDAIDRFGVHSAGSAALMGNTVLSRRLEERLADFLGYADCTVFPTGWGAGYGGDQRRWCAHMITSSSTSWPMPACRKARGPPRRTSIPFPISPTRP